MSINKSRRNVLKHLVACAITVPSFTAAGTVRAGNSKPLVYTDRGSNMALQGHDPVSYFKGSDPVKGSENFQLEYKKATWLFSSQENLAAFTDNPDLYAPQFGGYCAFSIAKGKVVKGDATLWAVVDGKLYINFNKGVHRLWLVRPQKLINKAKGNWPTILG